MEEERRLGRVGVIIGKFMPPHRGHAHLVERARGRVDRLVVLVYTRGDEPIPGPLRAAWMREMCPGVDVRHVPEDLPYEPHEDPRFWERWTESIRRACPDPPDVLFSSEAYGDELGRRLGVPHACVDRARAAVPISASRIRARPLEHWAFVPPPVRPYYVARVVLLGAESTGKTVLAEQLAERYGTVWTPEFARGYLDAKGAGPEADDMRPIARGQIALEEALARQANRLLVGDTDLLATVLWSEHFFGACDPWVEARALERSARVSLYLVTEPDLPWAEDWQRIDPALQASFTGRVWRLVERTGRPHATVSGRGPARLACAARAIDALLRA